MVIGTKHFLYFAAFLVTCEVLDSTTKNMNIISRRYEGQFFGRHNQKQEIRACAKVTIFEFWVIFLQFYARIRFA